MEVHDAVAAPGHQPVLIIDDHSLFSSALCAALRAQHLDAHCIAIAERDDILAETARFDSALVLLDLALGVRLDGRPLSGVDLLPELINQRKQVVVISRTNDAATIAEAIAAGALGQLPTASSSVHTVTDMVRRASVGEPVMSGAERERWLAHHRAQRRDRQELARRMDRLTEGEHDVLTLLTQGRRATDIAEQLVVPPDTVRAHIRAILAKLEVNSQLAAVTLVCGTPEILNSDSLKLPHFIL